MRKPKWATKRRYKIVNLDNMSIVVVKVRMTNSYRDKHRLLLEVDRGSTLLYNAETIVTSPNGVCRRPDHTCCRGIHAYKKISESERPINNHKIISIWSDKWYGHGNKQRALRVWVGNDKTK